MKFRLISKSADGLGLAFRIKEEGNDVSFYLKDEKAKHLYEGILPRVDNPVEGIDKDTIVIVDMVGWGKEVDALRKTGFKVYGASTIADTMELERDFGLDLADNLGIEVPYSEDFDNFEDAIKLVKKRDTAFVFKPEHNKEGVKTFVSQSPEQMIKMLEHFKNIWKGKVDFVMQEVMEGSEVSSEVWCIDGLIVPNSYNNTWETKRFLNDDYGPNTGCYSEDTEILTDSGWKHYRNLFIGEKVLTLNPRTGISEYQPIEAIWEYKWEWPLYHFQNKTLDLLVTHDHNMAVYKEGCITTIKADKLIAAKDSRYNFIRKSLWIAEDREYFRLPAYKDKPALQISMDNWLAFLGLYIAEGCASGNAVRISQKIHKPEMETIIKNSMFRYYRIKDGWGISSAQLVAYLSKLGHSHAKYIPREFLMLSSRQLKILFASMMMGDGSIHKNGQRTYYTSSKQLANDVQELLQKIGSEGIIRIRDRIGCPVNCKTKGVTRYLSYEIIERRKKTSVCRKVKHDLEPYYGNVWCITVPNHTIYVRRNGNAVWCGNCMSSTVKFNALPELYEQLFNEKTQHWLKLQKYNGPIDINCIISDGVPYMLEFTARMGYSAIYALCEGLNMDIGEFFAQCASGQAPDLDPSGDWLGALRATIGPYPHVDEAPECLGIPIDFGGDLTHIWPLDVMKKDKEFFCSGYDGIICEVTGADSNLDEMWLSIYELADSLEIPEMQIRSDCLWDAKKRIEEVKYDFESTNT